MICHTCTERLSPTGPPPYEEVANSEGRRRVGDLARHAQSFGHDSASQLCNDEAHHLVAAELDLIMITKGTMAIVTGKSRRTLMTIRHASSSLSRPTLTIYRETSSLALATVTCHSITTSKVDATIGRRSYHFKKKYNSQAGLGSLTWSVEDGELFLENGAGLIARFSPRNGSVGSERKLEGRFEIRKAGLGAEQLDEVLVTGIAELERRRRDAQDTKIEDEIFEAIGF